MEIFFKDNFLSEEDLKVFVEKIQNGFNGNSMFKDESFTDFFWKKYGKKFQEINSDWEGIYPEVTITSSFSPIQKHLDKQMYDEKYKVLIYLNDVKNGGTIFFTKQGELLIENKRNRLVIFDISLEHMGQKFEFDATKKKLAIGFRLKDKN